MINQVLKLISFGFSWTIEFHCVYRRFFFGKYYFFIQIVMNQSPGFAPPSMPVPPSSQLYESNDGVTFSTGSAHLYRSVVVSQRRLVTETNRRKEDGTDVDASTPQLRPVSEPNRRKEDSSDVDPSTCRHKFYFIQFPIYNSVIGTSIWFIRL